MSELGSALGTRDGKLLAEAGMMTKEKLMLLIASVPCFGEESVASCPDRIMGSCGQAVRMDLCAIGHMADYLIANGVVVREKGEWKPVKYNAHCSCGKSYGTYHYECQVCHRVSYAQPYGLNFCPNCGADMRKGENG